MAEIKQEPRKLTVYLSGDLDHHHAKELREEIDFAVRDQLPPVVVLDFGQVEFMDSSGIGLIMGRSRLMEEYGGTLEIHNPPAHIRKVLRISGADKLAVIRTHVRQQPEEGKESEHEYAQ
ncbi:MAG TPA: anti-anti-sigma factor [Ruminococcus sp.]|nr:anti-anti-sigma factor [Ruminococcus sp.]